MTKPLTPETRQLIRSAFEVRRGFTDEQVIALVDAGKTTTEICDALNASKTSVTKIIKRHGRTLNVPESFWTPELIAQLRDLWALRLSPAKIAARLGTTKGAVSGKVGRLNLPLRSSAESRCEGEKIKVAVTELLREGRAPAYVAAQLGAKLKTVRATRRRLDLPKMKGGRILVVYAPAPSKPLPVSLVPLLRVPDAPRPVSSSSCAWPMWSHTERPKFSADGLPLLCGGARRHGSYCTAHGRLAYVRKAEAA